MSIEIKHVTKRFGDTLALDDESLTLEENKIYGLLGNNGAGKSTLLNIVADRLPANDGQVLLDGADVRNNDRALGQFFLTSEQNLFPEDMKVRQAFRTAKLFYPAFDSAYAEQLADSFGLPLKKKISSLSTGYGTIFQLVLGLCVNTPYLFFDEPVLGLDAQHRDLFYRLLMEKYAEHPCTIVISTHLIAEVANLIEETIIIRSGRILTIASTEQLMADAYCVSGPAAATDAYIQGVRVLSVRALGGLKTACIQGVPKQPLPDGLELGKLNLQDYFICMMQQEDQK